MNVFVAPKKLKYQAEFFKVPTWAAKPEPGVRLDVLKDGRVVDKHDIDEDPYFLFGRLEKVVDFVLSHPTISRVHFALVHHRSGSCFVVDLDSGYGTAINGTKLVANAPTKVNNGDKLQVGNSSRTYVLHVPQAELYADVPLSKRQLQQQQQEAEMAQRREEAERELQEIERRKAEERATRAERERDERERADAQEREEEERMERLEQERLQKLAEERIEKERLEDEIREKRRRQKEEEDRHRKEEEQRRKEEEEEEERRQEKRRREEQHKREEKEEQEREAKRKQEEAEREREEEERRRDEKRRQAAEYQRRKEEAERRNDKERQREEETKCAEEGEKERTEEKAENKRPRSLANDSTEDLDAKKAKTDLAEAKAKEKARAAMWLDTAKQLIAPAYTSKKLTREAYKGLLSATMKHPFDTFDEKLPNVYALKAFLDQNLQKYDWTSAEKKALDSVFKAVLGELQSANKKDATPTKRSSSRNESQVFHPPYPIMCVCMHQA